MGNKGKKEMPSAEVESFQGDGDNGNLEFGPRRFLGWEHWMVVHNVDVELGHLGIGSRFGT